MSFKKKLICLAFVVCVSQMSLVSQAVLTKDNVVECTIRLVDELSSDLVSDRKQGVHSASATDVESSSVGVETDAKGQTKSGEELAKGKNVVGQNLLSGNAIDADPGAVSVVKEERESTLNQHMKKISEEKFGKELDSQRNATVWVQRAVQKYTYTDKKYVAEALNLLDPYIYHLTGVAQNFRFYDGSKEKISVSNLVWRFQDDEGRGSTNYMRLLFPSNAGVLCTETSANRECFSSTCHPTAQLLADMVCYFHDCVRNHANRDKASADLTELVLKDRTFLRKVLLQTEAKNVLIRYDVVVPDGKQKISDPVSTEKIEEIRQSDDKDKLIYIHNQLNPKNQVDVINADVLNRLRKNIKNGTFDYLPMEHFVRFDQGEKICEVDVNSFKLVLSLLYEGIYMITNQEVGGVDTAKFLPKYTTERMLMVYFFISKSNESDIVNFYDRVKKRLGENTVNPEPLKGVLDRLSKRAKMVQDLKFNKNSPYEVSISENSSVYGISKVNKERKVTFQSQTFQDCADITIRHIINLLVYDKEHKWSKLFAGIDGAKKYALQNDLDNILNAIQKHGSVDFKTLEERLQIFFLYQEKVGADAADKVTRSLWNYTISNMNAEPMDKLYPIEYVDGKNYELKSGFENSLMMLYNIACALHISTEGEREFARCAIYHLMCDSHYVEQNNLICAIGAVYRLFNENIEIDESSCFTLSDDASKWVGRAVIQSDTNAFVVEQMEGHARVIFDPIEKYNFKWLQDHEDNIFQDEMTMLLVGSNVKVVVINTSEELACIIDGCADCEKLKDLSEKFSSRASLFYKIYTQDMLFSYNMFCLNVSSDIHSRNEKYISNCKALKFLKGLQGEQDNEFRIQFLCNFLYGGFHFANITIAYKFNDEEDSVSMFIIRNYLLKIGLDNPEEKPWGETLKSISSNNIIVCDGVEYYCMIKDGEATLYPTCKVDKLEIIIPAKVNLNGREYSVGRLGAFAFYEANFETVTFEEGLEQLTLDRGVFSFCRNLKTVRFPRCLRYLHLSASFMECVELDTVIFPECVLEGLNFGNHSFRNCFHFGRLDLPKSVNNINIGAGCFSGCSVCGMKMPKGLKKLFIDSYAFCGMKGLYAFKLNAELEDLHVGELAFYDTSLIWFDVPGSVMSLEIERAAFGTCKNLMRLTIPKLKGRSEISGDVEALSEKLKRARA